MSRSYSPPPDPDEPIHVECYCRPAVGARDRQAVLTSHVVALEAIGRIDDYRIERWPERVALDDRRDRDVAAVYEHLAEWAEAPGRELGPAWQVYADRATPTRPARTALRPPTIAVACYRGDEPVAVAPAIIDGEAVTVEALLTDLTEGTPVADRPPLTASR